MNHDAATTADVFAVFAIFFAIYAAFILFVLLLSLASYVVLGFTLGSFFRKVGVESWIAWVPFYNRWKWLEVGGQPGWIALLTLVPGGSYVTLVFSAIGGYRTGIAFRKDGSWVVLALFLPWVWTYLLGRESEVYDPALIVAAGYPPPLAGYGSVPPGFRPPPPPAP